jgi:hypothetical protein
MSRSMTVECIGDDCGWQGAIHDTDAGNCPMCGDETLTLREIYGPGGLSPDPNWKDDAPPGVQAVSRG